MVNILMNNGADPNIGDWGGITPIHDTNGNPAPKVNEGGSLKIFIKNIQCQTKFLAQVNFQSIGREDIKKPNLV
ncbi:hypothetical protein [Candidatus Mesenet endosymbiont of Agriotes lineatus]|uniref:hypothetical protein n=1 Tax=Candidatus Mesenet endosymbiont of Agriotes lineatus TaxID=3077948 RepID=UPI0030D54F76